MGDFARINKWTVSINLFVLPVGPITREEEIDKIMKSINSLEDLIDYFIREEGKEPPSPDPFEIGAKIDEILSV